MRILDILGVQFNLKNDTYRLYKKATTEITARRISDISSEEKNFSNLISTYPESLSKSYFDDTLIYTPKNN